MTVMSQTNKPLPIIAPVLVTFAALCNFWADFVMTRGPGAIGPGMVQITAGVVLIAAAILLWVLYLRGYVNQQIEKRFQDHGPEKNSN